MKEKTLYLLTNKVLTCLIFTNCIKGDMIHFSEANFLEDVFTSRSRYVCNINRLKKIFDFIEITDQNYHEYLCNKNSIKRLTWKGLKTKFGERNDFSYKLATKYHIKHSNLITNDKIYKIYINTYEKWETENILV